MLLDNIFEFIANLWNVIDGNCFLPTYLPNPKVQVVDKITHVLLLPPDSIIFKSYGIKEYLGIASRSGINAFAICSNYSFYGTVSRERIFPGVVSPFQPHHNR